jgi:hypothetical protein
LEHSERGSEGIDANGAMVALIAAMFKLALSRTNILGLGYLPRAAGWVSQRRASWKVAGFRAASAVLASRWSGAKADGREHQVFAGIGHQHGTAAPKMAEISGFCFRGGSRVETRRVETDGQGIGNAPQNRAGLIIASYPTQAALIRHGGGVKRFTEAKGRGGFPFSGRRLVPHARRAAAAGTFEKSDQCRQVTHEGQASQRDGAKFHGCATGSGVHRASDAQSLGADGAEKTETDKTGRGQVAHCGSGSGEGERLGAKNGAVNGAPIGLTAATIA